MSADDFLALVRACRWSARTPYIDPDGSGPLEKFRPVADRTNDYLIDREKQARNEDFTGIPTIPLQDQAVTESMGPIYARSNEHLGTTDSMVIRTRRRLIKAAKA